MKKIYTLFLAALVFVSLQTNAQTSPNCNLAVSYNSAASPNGPNVISFTNTSTGYQSADTIQWTFGDGTSSSISNPTHTYTTGGTYHVCLIIRRAVPAGTAPCANYSCHDIVVTLPCNLTASFNSQPSTSNPLGVYFSNTSAGYAAGDSLIWSFGDGTYAYNVATAYHAYANAGTYTVCLRVRKQSAGTTVSTCVNEICHTVTVTAPCTLSAAFTSQPSTSNPLGVYFSNTSAGYATGDSLIWSFGDGIYAYNVANAYHAYANAGTYTVCLRVRKQSAGTTVSTCVNEICHTVTVTAPCTLSAAFTSQPSTSNPLGIYFSNTSAGYATGDSLIWSFGDGTYAYNVANAYHAYANAGTYTVCLRVRKQSAGATISSCVSYICHTVTVTAPCTLSATFTSQPSTSNPLGVYFSNTSAGYATGDSLIWSFGDGTYAYNVANAYHAYANAGTYTVCLRVRKQSAGATISSCVSYICHTVTVTAPCTLSAAFTSQPSTADPLQVIFTNTSTGFATGDSIKWMFGDGTFSYTANPSHTYASAGTYTVCLHVRKQSTGATISSCASDICHVTTVTAPNNCNLQAYFSYLYDNITPNLIHFTNQTGGFLPTDSISWTFGDGGTSTAVNPDHVYAANGTYTACIRIARAVPGTVPCVREYCKTIAITLPANPCNLHPSFTYSTVATNPATFYFTNTSTGYATGDSVTWSFGDGGTAYTYNAAHTYTANGNYVVCLRLKRNTLSGTSPCVRDTCVTISVTLPNTCTLQTGFTWVRDSSATTPYLYHFTNTSTPFNSTDSISWTFGDGGTSNAVNPSHVYANAGTYIVCLRVQKRNGNGGLTDCVRTTCQTIVAPQACNLHPNYTFAADAQNYHTIIFTNSTTPPATNIGVTWYFGDGTSASTYNATHTYTQPGTYYACLRIQDGNCVSYHCDSIHVVAPPCNVHSNYTSQASSQNALLIYFTNTTTPTAPAGVVASTTWYFGDGTTATTLNASHQYAHAGAYYVCLRTQYGDCVDYHCDSVHVTAPPCNVHSNYTSQASSQNSLLIYFTNTTTPTAPAGVVASTTWYFGDGTTATTLNASHQYAHAGAYYVCLRTQYGDCVDYHCDSVHVTVPPCNVHSNYTSQASSQNALLIYFTNTTTPTAPAGVVASTAWSFGDGTTATTLNASHQYAHAGAYYVCLRTQYGDCVDYHCDSVHVIAPTISCSHNADFHFTFASATGFSIGFTPNTVYTDAQYTWVFGDGSISHDPVITHTYATAGVYTVCLTVVRNGCTATSCMVVQVPQGINCNNIVIGFTDTRDSLTPNRITFHATSNAPIIDQVWTITRIPLMPGTGTVSIHAVNPVYIFPDTGSYNVCLHATFAGSCVKEYCRVIHITSPTSPTACSLQLYPNPATSSINAVVILPSAMLIHASIYNTMNMLVAQKEQQGAVGTNTVNINIGSLAAGVYTLQLVYGNQVCHATFIKQ